MAFSKHTVVILTILLLTCGSLSAQNWDEWFRQKKTQKKYLVQQIVALQLYMKQVKKGYDIVRKGWNTVQDITDGEFNLHREFLSALERVDPLVREDYRVTEVLRLSSKILSENRKVRLELRKSEHMTIPEVQYVEDIHDALAEEVSGLLKDLDHLLTDADLEMDDAQRIQHLGVIYRAMLRLSGLAHDFNGSVLILMEQRSVQENNLQHLRHNYDEEM